VIAQPMLGPRCPECDRPLTRCREELGGLLRCIHPDCLACRDFTDAEAYWYPLALQWGDWEDACTHREARQERPL
jgi:hypothetical protein